MDTRTAIETRQRRAAPRTRRTLTRLRHLQAEVQALKFQLAQVQARQEAQGGGEGPVQTHPPISERNARLIALLDTFDQGDAEEQRQEFEALQAGVEAARPGQRRVFGEGFNP